MAGGSEGRRSEAFHPWLLTLAVFLYTSLAMGASLKAGVAKVEITPPTGVMMWGYFDRTTPAQSTLDPLYARMLVLEAGETRLALGGLEPR